MLQHMPRKPVKPIGPWERLTPEDLEPLPMNSRTWALRKEKESETGPWAKPAQWGKWEDLPTEYQAALVWAYLYAGPSTWLELKKLDFLIEGRPSSLLKIISIENRKWMINTIKNVWPSLLDTHLEKGIAIFFQMNWESIKREFINHKNLLSAWGNFQDDTLEMNLHPSWKNIFEEGFRLSYPCPRLDMAHFYHWLMAEAEETANNGFDLAGRVVPILPSQFIQKRLVPSEHGLRMGFIHFKTDYDTFNKINILLRNLNYCCKTLIGEIPRQIHMDDRYGIGGQGHPLKNLGELAHKAVRSIMHHDVRIEPKLNLIGKKYTIEEYKKQYPDDF